MRAECAIFLRNPERWHLLVDSCCQRSELRASLHANPEYACRFSSREESIALKMNLRCIPTDRAQCASDRFNRRFRLLADELKGYVQRLWFHPASLGRKVAHSIKKACDALADDVLNIKCNKQSHKRNVWLGSGC